MRCVLLAGASLALLTMAVSNAAHAAPWGDWQLSPYETDIGPMQFSLGGMAHGALFDGFQPAAPGLSRGGVSGAASVGAQLKREYDTGMVLALKTDLLLAHDRLSGDNYGNDLLEKLYFQLQTGLGTVEVGMADGVGFSFAITGPVVDAETSLDNANAAFFRDPLTKRAFTDGFTLNSTAEASINYAKFTYYTPRLFGVQIGVSYSPATVKDVLPFAGAPPRESGRQESLWEVAGSYRAQFGKLEAGFSGAATFAHADEGLKGPNTQGLTEWALGTEFAYPLGEEMTISAGGGYRHSNAFAFDLLDVRDSGGTSSAHISAMIENGPFSFGVEYGDGTADGGIGGGSVGVRAYSVAASYALNQNLAATLGWQELRYDGDAPFYNGHNRINMDAVFLHLRFTVDGSGD